MRLVPSESLPVAAPASTRSGVVGPPPAPLPAWPLLSLPQQYVFPELERAQVLSVPVVMNFMFIRYVPSVSPPVAAPSSTRFGVSWFDVGAPLPSSPALSYPQQ